MKTRFRVFALVTLLLTSAISAFAQLPPEARAGLWKAQWITSSSAPQRDMVVLHFRKAIEVSAVPEHFVVHVSADSLFVLNVNQREVSADHRRPKPLQMKGFEFGPSVALRLSSSSRVRSQAIRPSIS